MKNPELKKKCMSFRKDNKFIDIKTLIPSAKGQTTNINFYHLIEKELSDLLKKTREIAMKKKYKYIWCRNSMILVRKEDGSNIIKINSVDDFAKLV